MNPKNQKRYRLKFYVVSNQKQPILGAPTCQLMKLLEIKSENILSMAMQTPVVKIDRNSILSDFEDVFQGYGKFEGDLHLRPMGLQWIMSVFWHFWVKYTKKFVISCRIVWSINVVNIGLTCFNMNKKSVYLIHYSMERAFACYNESTLDRKVLVKTSVL